MNYYLTASVLLAAYMLGSIPVANIFGKRLKGIDLRTAGDGNIGARNAFHQLGARYGWMVAALDILKGAIPVIIARLAGFDLFWQMMAGAAVILGHDFPLFAGLKGGQGLATSTGTMLALFFAPAAAGLAVYGILYIFIKRSTFSAAAGGGVIALILGLTGQWPQLLYTVCVFLFVPVKQQLDAPRRRAIAAAQSRADSDEVKRL
jgi:glycerol-3-phosphate acyltransferase PlsY